MASAVPTPDLVSLVPASPDEIHELEMAEIAGQIEHLDRRVHQVWRRTRLGFLLVLAGCAVTALLSLGAFCGVAYLIYQGAK